MSDEAKSRTRLIALVVVLLAAGGIIAWQVRARPGKVDDSTAEKANRLTQKAAELEDKQQAREVDVPERADPSGPKDVRGGG